MVSNSLGVFINCNCPKTFLYPINLVNFKFNPEINVHLLVLNYNKSHQSNLNSKFIFVPIIHFMQRIKTGDWIEVLILTV